ncbi:cytochrome c oxidase assembly protein subunit 15 [Kribbella amoyensis]|uniref:Cytochrome c oxidase assembly protein subunit 15 n=1 Tax=Kribbella amoyensis TaxID=996641 RepID=A0A561C009_9ACTN|nr:COX15/CtaA family protein [Kribbella amoyensis]TWD84398.1 cytochrome c oxidase assembly protein subunit 15 [Kribbella amoyensis]
MTTETPPRETEPVTGFWRLVPEPSLDAVRRWGWASVVANIGIVVTGGLVRLTGSGLGCPTWPQCTDESYVPHPELGMHGAIEFGNRMLGFVVAVVAIGTWLAVMRYRPVRKDLRRLATAAALGVPLQAVIGGISVLTGLNPWIVSAHFLVSPIIITLTVSMMRRSRTSPYPHTPPVVRALATASVVAVWLAVALGTLVTGAGPHSGDPDTGRNGFDETVISQLHADVVFALLGVTIALVIATRVTATSRTLRKLAAWLLAMELAQGVVGFVQYFTGLPWVLVLIHMFFAAVLIALVTAVYGERGTPAT